MIPHGLVISLALLLHCSPLHAEATPVAQLDDSSQKVLWETEQSRRPDWHSVGQKFNKKEEAPRGIFAFLASLPRLAVGVNGTWFDTSSPEHNIFSKMRAAAPVDTLRILAARISESHFKWDFTTGTGSFDVKSPLITGPWNLESLAGGDTSGRYRLGLKVSRALGSVTTSLAWRYSGSGHWGTDTGKWNDLLLTLAVSQWQFDTQWRLEEAQQRLRFALAWKDDRWKASTFHSTSFGQSRTTQYGLAWARYFTLWRFSTTLGLQWVADTDGRDHFSPWLQLAIPLGDFRLEWKMKYDDILSGNTEGTHQRITLSIQQ